VTDPTQAVPSHGLPPGSPPPEAVSAAQEARTAAEAAAAAYFLSTASTAVPGLPAPSVPTPEDETHPAMLILAGVLLRAAARQYVVAGITPEPPTDGAAKKLAHSLDTDARELDLAIEEGRLDPLTAARMLATRGLGEAVQQVSEDPAISDTHPPLPLKKLWVSKKDDRVRPLHQRLDGQTRPLNDAFWRWPSTGQVLDFPGDRRAPLDQTAGCRCLLFILPLG
jgi:hypothetical protein